MHENGVRSMKNDFPRSFTFFFLFALFFVDPACMENGTVNVCRERYEILFLQMYF